jgi:hypothetical protein
MRYKHIAVTILIAIACMSVAVWARPGQSTPKVQQWEYKSCFCAPPSESPNDLGALGWELVAVTTNENQLPSYHFKRPKN